jgi:hypothetical protein
VLVFSLPINRGGHREGVQERGAARVALLLASDAWGLGDELEMFWVLVGGRREGERRVRAAPNL